MLVICSESYTVDKDRIMVPLNTFVLIASLFSMLAGLKLSLLANDCVRETYDDNFQAT